MTLSREDVDAVTGLVTASGIVVAKQLPFREPPAAVMQSRFRPSGVSELPRLFARDGSPTGRLARLSSAALVYSVDKKKPAHPAKILRPDEIGVLGEMHDAREGRFKTDRSCPHCRLLHKTLYRDPLWRDFPPVQVVNHSARVNVGFDPDTFVSEATIGVPPASDPDDVRPPFQVIVPWLVAQQVIGLSHPLRWADPPGSMFQRVDAVDAKGRRGDDLRGSRDKVEANWERMAVEDGVAFVYEDVIWPVNEDIRANSENILRIERFEAGELSLSYTYGLERSVRSNFGVAWESGGLDVDTGFFSARAMPVSAIDAATIEDVPLGDLRRRDLLEMRAAYDPTALEDLYEGYGSDKVKPEDIAGAVTELGERLEMAWPHLRPFCVLSVSASKQLHFTIPENGPIEQWHVLTWMAPAILFTFLNRAICHAPHLIIDKVVKPRLASGATYAAV